MKKRAIECAADKEAVQEAERSKFLKEIRFLTQVLHAPENLFGLFRVVDEFQQICRRAFKNTQVCALNDYSGAAAA